jgi:hypothetical protein
MESGCLRRLARPTITSGHSSMNIREFGFLF